MSQSTLSMFSRNDYVDSQEYIELYRPLVDAIHAAHSNGDVSFSIRWEALGSESRPHRQNLTKALWHEFPDFRINCDRHPGDTKGLHVTVYFT